MKLQPIKALSLLYLTQKLEQRLYTFFLKHSLPVIESAASGSTFKEISGSAMKNIPAIIPDRNTLDQFNSFCAPIFAQQKILEEQNHSLAMLRDSLLPKLMSGAIDIASIQL